MSGLVWGGGKSSYRPWLSKGPLGPHFAQSGKKKQKKTWNQF